MITDVSRLLTLLRKERGESQKQAAGNLGISQALLSHYEKGIRECGLAFLCRAADYYGVSTDYLLGRDFTRSPMTELEKSSFPNSSPDNILVYSAFAALSELCANEKYFEAGDLFRKYLSLVFYRFFRIIHASSEKYDKSYFIVSENEYENICDSVSALIECELKRKLKKLSSEDAGQISRDFFKSLAKSNLDSVFTIIKNVEKEIGEI